MTEEIVSYGVLSLIPAILAVVLAFWTKNVIISLMASLFVGCLITAGWNPWNAMQVMFSDHLFVDMTGSSNAQTIIMMSFVGGFVALIEATGGAKAFAAAIANKVHRRSTAQTTAWMKLDAGPASATHTMCFLGLRRLPKLTGTGLA